MEIFERQQGMSTTKPTGDLFSYLSSDMSDWTSSGSIIGCWLGSPPVQDPDITGWIQYFMRAETWANKRNTAWGTELLPAMSHNWLPCFLESTVVFCAAINLLEVFHMSSVAPLISSGGLIQISFLENSILKFIKGNPNLVLIVTQWASSITGRDSPS